MKYKKKNSPNVTFRQSVLESVFVVSAQRTATTFSPTAVAADEIFHPTDITKGVN